MIFRVRYTVMDVWTGWFPCLDMFMCVAGVNSGKH